MFAGTQKPFTVASLSERFKNNHLKAHNITDKAQQRSLFLDSIGEATLDIFEQLSNSGTDLDGAVNALRDKFKESQNRLYNRHKFRPFDLVRSKSNQIKRTKLGIRST